MKFGPVPVNEAEGAVLAHSLVADKRIPKGTLLEASHVQALKAAGFETVTVARLQAGDVAEDAAAARLAEAVLDGANGLRATGAGAGRVNLYAQGCGLIRIDAGVIHKINAVDPMITIATVPDHHRVDADGMIATIKIISYAVSDDALEAACSVASGSVTLLPPVYKTATLIETTIGKVLPDKGWRAMAGRVERMGMGMTERALVSHEIAPLAQAMKDAPGEVVFVLTASATSDVLDVAPQAVRAAGGTIERFGMPVDPGNLLFLGTLGEKPVIGLPGCARSPALNGADWVLERVICGLEVTHSDISGMGVGGLLKEIPIRPMPRETIV
ncbi:molybdenum cofactor cytidylyltransferase [Shimia isoporae]|uniref:Molybdenum cofactor cytidylyltransferase n=1 Tax=Shimia isoporae TaxID=647720 RepID=A0A4R1NMW2_9RHOB|nr:molybdopterin-binding protein [Shimia isoporae]TCL09796.1 molybdenum cofactor cytidylyltransferase [Shimia isoporae]